MNEFEYTGASALVENMRYEAESMDEFPVLIGNEIAHFHEVDGGYNRVDGIDIVELIHRVQGHGSPSRVGLASTVEAHLSDNYYYLTVDSFERRDEYPDEDYVLAMAVEDYQFDGYSFSKAMREDVDRRDVEYNFEQL